MEKVAYTHVDETGRLQFHDADGKEHVVSGDKPYLTSDPHEIALLDETPSVKRAEKAKA